MLTTQHDVVLVYKAFCVLYRTLPPYDYCNLYNCTVSRTKPATPPVPPGVRSMPTATRVRSPLKCFGGKSYLAPKIVALMPPCRTFIESFCRGASVALARPPGEGAVIINDIDQNIAAFWAVLRDDDLFARFSRLCQATEFSETVWAQARTLLDFKPPWPASCDWAAELRADSRQIVRAWAVFVNARMSAGGNGRGFAALTKNRLRRGMQEQVSAWLTSVDGLPEVHGVVREWLVRCCDAIELFDEFDQADALHYMDPPYCPETRVCPDMYEHEMTFEQHERLLVVIVAGKAKVMISGYECDLYNTALKDWTRHEFKTPKHSGYGDTKKIATEMLWTNF